ncbi:hypothetical protein B9Z55_023956 [Caenorhabditis nigoni]|uniref:Uncharacterized protein n=1 Tax=Caenorhabditis nigoni TaxID=1611254 RepID=A0A2G5SRX7_9PELO|nr:hypothetical protein B9Z55_023956 [Caenorhabditis nigoni]
MPVLMDHQLQSIIVNLYLPLCLTGLLALCGFDWQNGRAPAVVIIIITDSLFSSNRSWSQSDEASDFYTKSSPQFLRSADCFQKNVNMICHTDVVADPTVAICRLGGPEI